MKLEYLIAALFILFGGVLILYKSHGNKALKLLSFFLIVYMARPIDDSHLVWAAELIFILSISTFKASIIKDNRWYVLFVIFTVCSLFYSEDPIRGIPGLVMYVYPLFYYLLTIFAIKEMEDAEKLFSSVSHHIWILIPLCILSVYDKTLIFSYYGMGICTIPAYMFIKTKKKKYVFQLLICLLPAFVLVKRTPLLGISVSMMIFSMLMYKWKAIIPSVLAVIIGIVIIVNVPSFRGKLFYDGDSVSISDFSRSGEIAEKVNVNGRLVFWSIVWDKYFQESPYLGAGQGSVKAYLQSDKNEYKMTFSLMHNDWLLILCEQGMIGVLLLLVFFGGLLRRCIKYSAKRYPRDLRLMSAACAGSVVSTMNHMFFENCMNTFIVSTSFVFYALLNVYIRRYKIGLN